MSSTRRPAWRRDRAEEYASEYLRFSEVVFDKKEDALVIKLTEYLMTSRAKRSLSRSEKRKLFPKIQDAFEIYCREDAFSDKWIIEALALSDLTYEQISSYSMVPEGIVAIYCLSFFDVKQPDIRSKLAINIRLLCAGEAQLRCYDIGWKYLILTQGVEIFAKVVLNRTEMGKGERTLLNDMTKNAAAYTAWWSTEKISMNPDKMRSEMEMMQFKHNHDINKDLNISEKLNNGSGSCMPTELCAILEKVAAVTVMSESSDKTSEKDEPRLR